MLNFAPIFVFTTQKQVNVTNVRPQFSAFPAFVKITEVLRRNYSGPSWIFVANPLNNTPFLGIE
jgi:hypothetical protein